MNNLDKQEEREAIIKRDRWTCQHCGKPANWQGTLQLAHLIAETKSNRKKYGNCVIDHPLNRVLTCSLYCNGRMNIGNNPAQANELADKIRDELLKE